MYVSNWRHYVEGNRPTDTMYTSPIGDTMQRIRKGTDDRCVEANISTNIDSPQFNMRGTPTTHTLSAAGDW